MPGSELTHVIFELEVDDGWPPVSGERVWAEQLDGERFQLRNVPQFARGVAEDDIVRAVASTGNEWPVFVEKLELSGNLAIRIIPYKAGRLAGSQERVLAMLAPFGVGGEGAGSYPFNPHRSGGG